MQASALVQLCQAILQIDERRGANPCSCSCSCTRTVLVNVFRRTLDQEKEQADIRDEILKMNGASPSCRRQVEHEMAERQGD